MLIVFGLLLFLALAILPTLWVRAVLDRHSGDRPDFPGTGGELARHLLDEMRITGVKVEETPLGDHYDPGAKAVRLSPKQFHGRSLTAVTIAAHEVGHAMQDATNSQLLKTRTRLAKTAIIIERVGGVVMLAAPLAIGLTRHPAGALIPFVAGLLVLGMGVVLQLSTLPVELDASFNRALPVLKAGKYVPERDIPAARHILRAAAFTYVAAALMSLINIARWLRVLRL
ncbi:MULTISPECIES: zinc metallopeptidase [Rhodomicrobium]|uniref:zinc metallopeptidase n=1 Tax=Rhodomicrobium TaxID=1068 RepID=UPI000B4B71F7|nr:MULTISPECIES: zinc metallopeptidase [Rhodomicrobium]